MYKPIYLGWEEEIKFQEIKPFMKFCSVEFPLEN